jgi:hypothetical protein
MKKNADRGYEKTNPNKANPPAPVFSPKTNIPTLNNLKKPQFSPNSAKFQFPIFSISKKLQP